MKRFFAILCVLLCVQASSRAYIVLSVSPLNAMVPFDGSGKGVFNVNIKSTTDVRLGGVDFNLLAEKGDGTEGRFDFATRDFFPDTPGVEEWGLSVPGQAFYTQNVLLLNPTGTALTANQETLFGTIRLDVTGVAAGTYVLSFEAGTTAVLNSLNQNIPNVTTIGSSYSITAVPEPGSLLLLSSLGTAAGCWIRLRRTKSQVRGLSRVDAD